MTKVSLSIQIGDESITAVGVSVAKALKITDMLLGKVVAEQNEVSLQEAYGKAFSKKTEEEPQTELPRGVREIDGRRVYRAKYDCVNCGHSGTRFIWPNSTYAKCHECQTKHSVEPAIAQWDDGTPVVDADGFYFYASGLYIDKNDALFAEMGE